MNNSYITVYAPKILWHLSQGAEQSMNQPQIGKLPSALKADFSQGNYLGQPYPTKGNDHSRHTQQIFIRFFRKSPALGKQVALWAGKTGMPARLHHEIKRSYDLPTDLISPISTQLYLNDRHGICNIAINFGFIHEMDDKFFILDENTKNLIEIDSNLQLTNLKVILKKINIAIARHAEQFLSNVYDLPGLLSLVKCFEKKVSVLINESIQQEIAAFPYQLKAIYGAGAKTTMGATRDHARLKIENLLTFSNTKHIGYNEKFMQKNRKFKKMEKIKYENRVCKYISRKLKDKGIPIELRANKLKLLDKISESFVKPN